MPVTKKTGRIRDRVALGMTFACIWSVFALSLATVTLRASAADTPASSSAPAAANTTAAQVEAALAAADATAPATPAALQCARALRSRWPRRMPPIPAASMRTPSS